MKASQKAALSLLITVLLFSVFTALAFTGLFDQIETRFYNPALMASITREITQNTEVINNFFTDMQNRFSQTLREPAVQRSFLINQTDEDIFERSRIYGSLHESLGGLQWVRFIDSGGLRIHFSTYAPDILAQDHLFVTYRHFNEPNFPYAAIAVGDGGAPRVVLDGEGDRILLSFPFYDYFDVHRGTALFSLSVRALSDLLIRAGRLHLGHDLLIISNPPGFLSGTPSAFVEEALVSQVSSIWRGGALNATSLYSLESGISLSLLSVRGPQGFLVGRLVDNDLFLFPQIMKVILLLSFFLTVYLTIFLLFNFKQDPVTIIQDRMKTLQLSLIEQYYEHKTEIDWSRWGRELEQRRDEIDAQLKRGIKITSGKKARDIDTLIDKSWDELVSVIGGFKESTIDENKLQLILNRFLAAIPTGAAAPVQVSGKTEAVEEVEELEEIEAEEAEEMEVEELEKVEPMEELEEVEAAEEVEELEELEDPADGTAANAPPAVPEINIARVASEIEFANAAEPENTGDKENIWEGFEVVSPFSDTLSKITQEAEVQETAAPAEEILEELSEETNASPAGELLPLSETSKKKISHGMNPPQA